jgi:catalase
MTDDTKVWPYADYPLQKIGKLTLDRNPSNYFAEVEQAAFSPSSMVPGIDVSNDRVLQGRLFSYPDTQRYRVGPNFQQLPINQPYRANVSNCQRDGLGTYSENFGAHTNYKPQSEEPNGPQEQSQVAKFAQSNLSGKTGRYPYRKLEEDFIQPRNLYHLLEGKEQDDLIKNIVGHIKNVKNPEIIKRQIALFAKADPDWGRRVEEGVKATGKRL